MEETRAKRDCISYIFIVKVFFFGMVKAGVDNWKFNATRNTEKHNWLRMQAGARTSKKSGNLGQHCLRVSALSASALAFLSKQKK